MRPILYTLLILAGLLLTPDLAQAGDSTLFASSYWARFKDHWLGFFQKQNGIIMLVLLVGAASIFVITRGKWKK
jgi:hypothetical protein